MAKHPPGRVAIPAAGTALPTLLSLQIPNVAAKTLESDGSVATITLHRPDRMNAFTDQMVRDMIAAFDETDANDDVRAVIVPS